MTDPIRVLIADDHPIVRAGLTGLLSKAADILVVGQAENGTQTLELVASLTPDVLLLDMEMPGLSGVEVARSLKASGSPVRILALSAYDESQYIRELLNNGAAGYLLKDEAMNHIVDAVRGVARGEGGWFSRRAMAQIVNERQNQPATLTLTSRECDVLRLIVAGKTNQEIGYALGISEKTVQKYLAQLFEKMDASSRVEVAVRAVRENLV